MSNQHKNPTISFRVSEYERKAIEARILASGMMKKDYFVRSFTSNAITTFPTSEEISALQTEYEIALKAIIDMLDGAKYLWEGEHHE